MAHGVLARLITTCLCMLGVSSLSEEVREAPSGADRSYHFSTRTAYHVVKGDGFSQKPPLTGCETQQVYQIIRHGTRYPGQDEAEDMHQLLPALAQDILNHGMNGSLSAEALSALRQWEPIIDPERGLQLSDVGLQEMYGVGRRLAENFPELFPPNQSEMELRYTDKLRSRLSAEYFAHGLLYNAVKSGEHVIPLEDAFTTFPAQADNLLLYCDTCKNYVMARISMTDREKEETAQFDESSAIAEMLKSLDNRFGLPAETLTLKQATVMYEACRYEYALCGEDTWCRVLGSHGREVFEYRQDMKYYWRYGHGRPINYQPSCLLLQDIMRSIRDYNKGNSQKRSLFRFGHSRTLLPLLVMLGLYNDTIPLQANNMHLLGERLWRLSVINPFSSNVAFVAYKCQKELYLRVLVNENEVAIPGCGGRTFCALRDAFTHWKTLTKDCDFSTICDNNEDLDLELLNSDTLHHA